MVFPAYAGLIPPFPQRASTTSGVFPAYAGLIPLDRVVFDEAQKVFPAYAGLILKTSNLVKHRLYSIPRLCGVDSTGRCAP